MTPKSIRGRLMPFFKMRIKLPLTFLSHKHSSKRSLFRYSKAFKDFFINNIDEKDIQAQLLIGEKEWAHLLFHFFQFTYNNLSLFPFRKPILKELSSLKDSIIKTSRYAQFSKLYSPITTTDNTATNPKDVFCKILKAHFCFSNALIADYIHFLEKEASNSNKKRKKGEIIYYAVSDNTISGTPLWNTEFVPVKLTIWA